MPADDDERAAAPKVELSEFRLPDLPADDLVPVCNELRLRDHDAMPPTGGAGYPVLVPQADEDGIPGGGIELPRVSVPLGTHRGWNLRAGEFAASGCMSVDDIELVAVRAAEDFDAATR